MGFNCIMPMLETIHELIKFAQSQVSFICDFVGVLNMCCANLYTLYYDQKKRQIGLQFKNLMDLVDCINGGTQWIEPSNNILDVPFSIFKVTNIKSNIVNASQQKGLFHVHLK